MMALPVQLLAGNYYGLDDGARFLSVARDNDLAKAQRMLDAGIDPDTHAMDGQTALMVAAHHGRIEMMKLLIDAGAGLNKKAAGEQSVLSTAVNARQADAVVLLLESGARISGLRKGGEKTRTLGYGSFTRPNERANALRLATDQPESRLLDMLLQAGINPDEQEAESGRTALMEAAAHGDAIKVERLLAAGADPVLADNRGHDAMHYVLHGRVLKQVPQDRSLVIRKLVEAGAMPAPEEIARCYGWAIADDDRAFVSFLIDRGIGPNVPDGGDDSPLLMAVKKDRPLLVQLLLERGANTEWRNPKGETAVMHVLRSPDVFALLREYGADLSVRDARGWSVLRRALLQDREMSEDIFVQLVEYEKSREEIQTVGGEYLHHAIIYRKVKAAAALARAGADLEHEYSTMDKRLLTPLQQAIGNSLTETALVLLEASANPDHIPAGSEAPLQMAAYRADEVVVSALLKAGADVNRISGNNRTALQRSMGTQNSLRSITLALLDAGARADIGSADANEILMSDACRKGDLEVVRRLVSAGVRVNARPDSSLRPLSSAAISGSVDLVRFLIEQGADVNAVVSSRAPGRTSVGGNNGRYDDTSVDVQYTALMSAVTYGNSEVVRMLLKKGAHVDAIYHSGLSSLMLVIDDKQLEKRVMDALHARQVQTKRKVRAEAGDAMDAFSSETRPDRYTELNPDASNTVIEPLDELPEKYRGGKDTVNQRGALYRNKVTGSSVLVIDSVDMTAAGPDYSLLHADRERARQRKRDAASPEIISLLIAAGANINRQDTVFGLTPLMQVIKAGRVEAVKLLVEAGARLDQKDLQGRTAKDYLASYPDPDIDAIVAKAAL
jgi:ankyrin repeat protein